MGDFCDRFFCKEMRNQYEEFKEESFRAVEVWMEIVRQKDAEILELEAILKATGNGNG